MMWARQYLTWWPLHPIGFAISGTWLVRWIAFSVFLAWLIKVLVLRYAALVSTAAASLFSSV